ncbi:hypothetical protein BG004_001620, partial [Podila humilis]
SHLALLKSFPALVKEIDATNKNIHHISPKELHSSLAASSSSSSSSSSSPYIIDVRERNEIERTGTIPGAIALPRGILERDIGKFIKNNNNNEENNNNETIRDVVVYCAGGFRSILAAESLTRLGYGVESEGTTNNKCKVYSLDEGMDGWIKNGFSVEKK